ncbi:MAG: hypothetical protein J1G38_06800 [Clostridiales bacterium]|nr:hypothetical protein [Clostridiales bacterium]
MDETLKKELQKLIAYQKKDMELRKLNLVIERDAALIEKNKQKKAFNDAKQKVEECEQASGALLSTYAELCKYVDDNEAAFSAFESGTAETEEELEERIRKLESFRTKFTNADKKAGEIDRRSKEIGRVRGEAMKSGKIARQKYNEASDKHNELVSSKAAEIAKLTAELDALRSELSAQLLAEYNKLDAENKFPPVVPATGDERKGMFNCGGCGLNLSQQGNTLLKDKGWCHCDTCRRIIVKLN